MSPITREQFSYVPENLVRHMRMFQIVAEALQAIPRDEYELLFQPLIGRPATTTERTTALCTLMDLLIRLVRVYTDALERASP
jgi:hypothetical protein